LETDNLLVMRLWFSGTTQKQNAKIFK